MGGGDGNGRFNLQLTTQITNLFNRVQFNQPNSPTADLLGFGHSTEEIGRPDGTTGARQIQMGIKLSF